MRVAIQGEPGSFSHQAAKKMLQHARILPCKTIREVFVAVKKGSAQAAVVPVENSITGPIKEHQRLVARSGLSAVSEIRLNVVQCLIAAPGVKIKDVQRVYSHPVALAQCGRFFQRNPQLNPVRFYDTAAAVRYVIKGHRRTAAAIGPALAAKEYGGKMLRRGVQDRIGNYTRFVLLEPKVFRRD